MAGPKLNLDLITEWAVRHRAEKGTWPTVYSGIVQGGFGDTWRNIDKALRLGYRTLPKGSSLAAMLKVRFGARNHMDVPDLEIDEILQWADLHQQRTSSWPTQYSGEVVDAPGETWKGINHALQLGYRGFPGASSLADLLAEHRGVRNIHNLPDLRICAILDWGRAYFARTGALPRKDSGPIAEAPGETWAGVAWALANGRRGLRAGSLLRLMRQIQQ